MDRFRQRVAQCRAGAGVIGDVMILLTSFLFD